MNPFSLVVEDEQGPFARGNYATLFHGWFNGVKVAVKRVEIANLETGSCEELALLKLNHPNVLSCLGTHEDNNFNK